MNTWRGAWHIFKYDMKRDRYGFIFNILFYTYLVVVMMPLANLGKDSPNIYWLKDALYFSVLPNMGYIFSKNIFRYWSDDTFSRKLLLYRTLPITAKQFVAARFFNLMVTMLLGWLYFFGLQYMLTSIFFDAPNLAAYAGQALFWLGYATIMGVTYVYWELCHSGKVFVIATLPYFLFYGLLVYLCYASGFSAILLIYDKVLAGGWWIPVTAILIAAAVVLAGWKMITIRVKARVMN